MPTAILGVNSAYHESSACLVVDGTIVAVAEEERFNRVRHGKHSRIDNPDDLPLKAIEFCLQRAGLGWRDLTAIGYSFDPEARRESHRSLPDKARIIPGDWGTDEGEEIFYRHNLLARAQLLALAPQASFHFLGHHLCHAASAYLVSPFDDAAVLVVDGIGELGSTWLGHGAGCELRELETAAYPHSIGFVWEKLSEFLGFDAYSGPGKVMGYACITDPRGELSGRDYLAAMREVFRPVTGGTFFVDNEAFRFRTNDFSGLERFFGPRRKIPVDRYEDASIAAALQTATSDVLVHLADRLYDLVNAGRAKPVTDLCLAGGVALNCVANYEIAKRCKFERIWVQPAANDAGTAVGAAALLHHRLGCSGRLRMEHCYLGPDYSADECRAALEEKGLDFTCPDDLTARVAARIERGEVVAWFQGRQEVGPRALGNRTILADPSRFDTRTRLNMRVKQRESFRPFAPSVLAHGVDRFFDAPAEMVSARYMLFALPLKDRRDLQVIPAVVQENGSDGHATSRIHLIDEQHNPLYAQLVRDFEKLTSLPMVLNTSFNISEPIVTTPREAVATFLRSSMDGLALGPYLAERPRKR